MCDPTAIAIGSLVLSVGSKIIGAHAQDKQAEATKIAALDSAAQASKDISVLESQQISSTAQTIFEADRQARATKALARVSAGEAGVTGVSVEALMGDIDRRAGEFRTGTERNLDMALAQLQREKESGRTIAQERIAASPKSSPLATGIAIAGSGLAFWAGQINRTPPASTK